MGYRMVKIKWDITWDAWISDGTDKNRWDMKWDMSMEHQKRTNCFFMNEQDKKEINKQT